MRQRYLIFTAIITCAVSLLGNNMILARDDEPTKTSDRIEQLAPSPDEEEPIRGYPARKRYVGGPTDVEWDLDNSFPKRGSVLELTFRCQETHD